MDWANERVLVTGAEGFLGRHLMRALRERGAGELVRSGGSRDCDLRDVRIVGELLRSLQPTLIFHLAARCGGIGANQAAPATFLFDNAVMGLNLFEEASHLTRKPKLVCVATICSYPAHCPPPFLETDLWNGYPEPTNAPYGIAKKLLTVAAGAYRTERDLTAVVAYPANLYGPGDHYDPERSHVIPALIRKFDEAIQIGADHVTIWGTGTAEREFLYAPDCAEALCRVAESYDSPEPINLGGREPITIAELAALIAKLIGFKGELRFDPSRPDGQMRRRIDSSRAQEWLGWTAATPLYEGMRATLADWRTHHGIGH